MPESALARLIGEYGEEPRAKRVARAIALARSRAPIATSKELADTIQAVLPRASRIHPATRTFQALRIATNEELDRLAAAMTQAVDLLAPDGRLAVISFHSLEDRVVKHSMLAESRGCRCPPKLPICVCGARPRLRVLTKKPIAPAAEEVRQNPRSRSAKLRIAERLNVVAPA